MKPGKIISFVTGTEKGRLLLDQVVFSATSFITTILLARQLGIEQFGLYSLIIIYLYLLLGISSSLVISPFQVLLARHKDREEYTTAVTWLQILVTGMLLGITLILLYSGAGRGLALTRYAPQIILLTAGFLLHDHFRRVFISLGQGRYALRIDLISGLLQLAALLLLYFIGALNLSVSLFVIGITYVPAVLTGIFLLRKSCGPVQSFRAVLRLHWQQGRWLLLSSFLQWWANHFLVAVSGLFLGIRAMGALRLAQTLFGVLNALFQVYENYAVPRASARLEQSAAAMQSFLRRLSGQGLVFLLPVLLVTALFPGYIFRICGGEEYTGYAYALQGMAVLYAVIIAGYPVRIAIRVLMLNRAFFMAYLLVFVFTLLASKYLVSRWELTGVMASLIINQLIILGYWQWVLARKNIILWK